ncbi:hypothetical protein K458DRAFT_385682 [Lentithecium fluviatile CBS 122367]|uniref:Uncharacterized protein n=1 Tax=Lentithecium fluviatile CBS 122367 TaxID=1168545 RepID=A0A6G1JD10_9PLEO|nr:hypothetical protein K458DRAFT_385682 [Lentithecium fluviatile CBS 122367]
MSATNSIDLNDPHRSDRNAGPAEMPDIGIALGPSRRRARSPVIIPDSAEDNSGNGVVLSVDVEKRPQLEIIYEWLRNMHKDHRDQFLKLLPSAEEYTFAELGVARPYYHPKQLFLGESAGVQTWSQIYRNNYTKGTLRRAWTVSIFTKDLKTGIQIYPGRDWTMLHLTYPFEIYRTLGTVSGMNILHTLIVYIYLLCGHINELFTGAGSDTAAGLASGGGAPAKLSAAANHARDYHRHNRAQDIPKVARPSVIPEPDEDSSRHRRLRVVRAPREQLAAAVQRPTALGPLLAKPTRGNYTTTPQHTQPTQPATTTIERGVSRLSLTPALDLITASAHPPPNLNGKRPADANSDFENYKRVKKAWDSISQLKMDFEQQAQEIARLQESCGRKLARIVETEYEVGANLRETVEGKPKEVLTEWYIRSGMYRYDAIREREQGRGDKCVNGADDGRDDCDDAHDNVESGPSRDFRTEDCADEDAVDEYGADEDGDDEDACRTAGPTSIGTSVLGKVL